MPLNVQNKEYVTIEEESQHPPILHQPKKEYSSMRYFLMGFFIVIVVTSAVFLIYLLSFNIQQGPQPSQQIYTTEVGEGTTQIAKPPTEAKPPAISEAPVVQQPAVKFIPGLYTVYIGSYIIELPASEEVGRWHEAGFSAAVIHANNHFRVALGNYVSVEAAQKFADQMWEAFEYGYWIGRVE